ncbi:hypothetical protein CXB51_024440 [Gossypium anomalum]|uniref:DUF7745 domain-containing protein n=1 Tax=Gossypium anomalum TaxID=47600 RepID=A0A8J5YDA3_9ROSI|nr:hypothetical protein CXB51_024440 [Gossypium anomalum]
MNLLVQHLKVSIHGSISKLESFVMRNEYLDKVEDNASNEFQELRDIWAQWDDEAKQLFYQNYGDLPYLLDIKVDKHLFRAMVQFWNPAYSCFTFREAAARIQQKGDGKCIPWASLRDLILAHPDVKRRVDVLALSIYGLVIFPTAMGHIDEAVTDLFDRLGKQNTTVPAILAETFRSLNACQRVGEDYSPLKEAAATLRRDDIIEERWIEILQNLQEEDVMWKAPWMTPSEILYRCRSFNWVPLPGIWVVVSYTPLLVLRKYKAEQFIPATQGLAQSDFSYKGDHYKKKMREISEAWKKVSCVKILIKGSMTTFEYKGWFSKRVNDNIPRPGLEAARSMEENLRVIPSELEVIKQEFERKNLEHGRKIERLEEKKMYLSLDIDVQKIRVEKVRKEKRKIEEDRDDLKMQYKKIQLSLKRAGLGKSSDQWQQKVQEERAKVEYWEKKFQEMQVQNQALEKENQGLKANVTELGRSLHHH